MPSATCPPSGLYRVLQPSHEACWLLVLSNPGLGDAIQGAEGVLFLAEDDEAFLNSVHEQRLAELEPGNVAMQIGRIFRARRARLPSCRCWRRQVLLRSPRGELVGLWRYHDDLGHRSDGCKAYSSI
jgi:hypothetical protein